MTTNPQSLLNTTLVVINVGVQDFADNLVTQEVEVIHVDWSPPAGGDAEMMAILGDLL